jgi:hypothetical protein
LINVIVCHNELLGCSPWLDHPAGEISGVIAHGGCITDEPLCNDINGLLPMALWGGLRYSPYSNPPFL